jgi:hypothetical protein
MRLNHRHMFRCGLLLCLLLFIISCSEGDFTIFYQVINEKAIQDTDLNNTLTDQSVMKVDFSAPGNPDRYYVASGKIFTRVITSNNWDSVSNQTSNDEKLCSGLAVFGGNTLFGSFYSTDGKNFGLYTVDIDTELAPSPKDITWNPVSNQFVDGKQVGDLKMVLFISVKAGNNYSLVYFNGGYGEVSFDLSKTLPVPVRDVTFDGLEYWYITGSRIYQTSGSIDSADLIGAGGPRVSGPERFEGIIYTKDNQMYVSTSEGHIWFRDNGGTWDPNPAHFKYQASTAVEDDVWFTKFLEVPDTNPASPIHMVVVGTHGAGFFEIDETQQLADIERFGNTSKKELYSGSVGAFFVDPDDDTFFVLTLGSGLWRSKLTDGNWESWTWE